MQKWNISPDPFNHISSVLINLISRNGTSQRKRGQGNSTCTCQKCHYIISGLWKFAAYESQINKWILCIRQLPLLHSTPDLMLLNYAGRQGAGVGPLVSVMDRGLSALQPSIISIDLQFVAHCSLFKIIFLAHP